MGGPQRVLERWRCAVSAGPEGWVNVSLEKWVRRKGVGEERGFQAEPLNRKRNDECSRKRRRLPCLEPGWGGVGA